MKRTNKVKIGSAVALIIILGLFFHYNLPRTAVVQISGTDIKRMDKTEKVSEQQSQTDEKEMMEQRTSDVRFINSMSRDKKTMVFRNEDTGWGWPPYFKFNSADLTAKAQSFATDQTKSWVLVKYYGWRFSVFSKFPNVLSLKKVDRNYRHFPLFNIVFLILFFAFVVFARIKIKKLISRIRG